LGVVKINKENLKKLSSAELKKLRSSNHISDELRNLIDEILWSRTPSNERKYIYERERKDYVQEI